MYPLLIEICAAFLCASIVLYCVFAGADFGAGILELFTSGRRADEQRELISHAMGPVWEANHVWLILAIVILFNGFPEAYGELSITFHIPLTVMLLGIICRGCAFTFRHYDAVKDGSQKYYNMGFMLSSVVTPFSLGVIAGGCILGKRLSAAPGFWGYYVAPWCNAFSAAVGLFVCTLFAFLAAVYLIGETEDPELKAVFRRKARVANVAAIVSGLLVFVGAQYEGFRLARVFVHDRTSLICSLVATLLLVPLWKFLRHERVMIARFIAAAQMTLVLVGWFALQFPTLIVGAYGVSGKEIGIYTSAAPQLTLRYLAIALVAGTALILPALFILLRVFKRGAQLN